MEFTWELRLAAMAALCCWGAVDGASEMSLQQRLLTNYSIHIKPTPFGTPVMVAVHMVFFGIMDLSAKTLILTTNAQVIYEWNDPRLKWNPSEENGLTLTRMKADNIWIPDVFLYNSATPQYANNMYATNAILRSDGRVTYIISAYFFTGCNLDYSLFPFDQQRCVLQFVPLTMNSQAVKLYMKNESADLSQFGKSGEFRLVSLKGSNDTFWNPSVYESFDMVTYTVEIQRRSLFYVLKYIYPSLMINAVGALVFYIPCECGEKVTMGISAMLNMMVFLMNVANDLPSMTTYPYLSTYYCISVTLLTCEVVVSCISLKMFFRSQQNMPASDLAIGMAYIMAKLSFSELKDPRGYFRLRKEYMLQRFCNKPPSPDFTHQPRKPVRVPSLSVSEAENISKGEAWNNPSEKKQDLQFFGLMDKKYLGGSRDDNVSRIGLRPRLSKSSDSKTSLASSEAESSSIGSSPDVAVNVTNTSLERKMDKVLNYIGEQQIVHEEGRHDEILRMEFEAISRVYDHFFLLLTIFLTFLLCISMFWVSPYLWHAEGF